MKPFILRVIRLALIILFTYASVVKLISNEVFQKQLSQSPLIDKALIPMVSYGVPFIELFIVFLLINDKFLQIGSLASFFVMLFFSIYLLGIYNLYDRIPCACGGILGKMSYPVHISFNFVFTVFSLILYLNIDYFFKSKPKT